MIHRNGWGRMKERDQYVDRKKRFKNHTILLLLQCKFLKLWDRILCICPCVL